MKTIVAFLFVLSFSFSSPLRLFGASVFKGYRDIPKVRTLILEDSIQQIIETPHAFWIGFQKDQRLYAFPKAKDRKSLKSFLLGREQSQKPLRFAVDPYARKIAVIRDVDKSSR
jgi:hypothetical protein